MRYIGIDPGLKGGLALVWDGRLIEVHPMPIVATRKGALDEGKLSDILRRWCVDTHAALAVMEQVGAMPGQGVTSMFTFGWGAGSIWGMLAAFGQTRLLVPPRTWQKVMHAGTSPGDTKARSLLACQRLWPQQNWLATPRSRVPHDGMCDAALIAAWGERRG